MTPELQPMLNLPSETRLRYRIDNMVDEMVNQEMERYFYHADTTQQFLNN